MRKARGTDASDCASFKETLKFYDSSRPHSIGPLRPASKTYRVRIVHFRRTIFEGWTLANDYVTVHVVAPLLGAEMLANETLLPHIYWNHRNSAWPALCLWDPPEMFWTPEMLIATTIIPWTSEWLLFFEYWL